MKGAQYIDLPCCGLSPAAWVRGQQARFWGSHWRKQFRHAGARPAPRRCVRLL